MPDQTTSVGMERKLTAILSTDVAGYSRLMGDDEEATIRTLTAHRALISSLIQHYRGRVVDAPGDNLLAEFASVVDAVRCAVEIQQELKGRNAELPEQRRMEFRIGINLGDVVVEGERLYGDGVNIAARLKSLAIPGGICISGTVYDHVENKLALECEYQGEQVVKNITKPVRVYRVVMDDAENQKTKVKEQKAKVDSKVGIAHRSWVIGGIGSLVLIAGTVVTVRYFFLPVPSTQSLAPSTQAQLALPLPDKPSLVVLPFVNMSKDPEQDYFSDGLTEVLTGDLSKISSLFVIARNSAFTYKGKAVNVQDIGKELGVRYVLEGSVQKANEQVRIVAQLIDTTTDSHLWSERYDRPLTDLFALQDEIVQKIVTTLKLQLTLDEKGYSVRKHTDSLEAYDAFLRGMEFYWRLTQKDNVQARKMFEKAIVLDPQYAEAYAGLGWTYALDWIWHWSADPQALERGSVLAQQALTLDDSLPLAYSLLSAVYAQQQQYDRAIAEGERAIALGPNNADRYTSLAEVLNFAGRSEDAIKLMEQAMRLNPRYPSWYLLDLGWAYQQTGRYAEAIVALKEASNRDPNFQGTQNILAFSYLLQWVAQQSPPGQTLEPALVAIQRSLALSESFPWSHIMLSWIYLYQQQYEQALTEMERSVALGPTEAWSYAALAEVLSRMGRTKGALEAAAQGLRLKPLIADGP